MIDDPAPAVLPVASLAQVQPQARQIVVDIASLCRQEFGPDLVTLLIHGSAAKGGIIERSSDLDFVLFVDQGILTAGGELPLERAIRFHRNLAQVEPAPFRYLQGHICTRETPPGIGFVPGTYHVVLGSTDVPHTTRGELLASAEAALASLDPARRRDKLSNALMNHGEDRLFREVRWLCTDVWPAMFQVACLLDGDGYRAWQRTKHQTVAFLASDPIIGAPARSWLDAATDHYAAGEMTGTALNALTAGSDVLEAASCWFRTWSVDCSTSSAGPCIMQGM